MRISFAKRNISQLLAAIVRGGGNGGGASSTPAPAFAWDPAGGTNTGGSISYTNANRTATVSGGSSYATAYAAVPRTSGKIYFEVVFGANNNYANVGIAQNKYTGFAQDGTAPLFEHRSENTYWNGSAAGKLSPWAAYTGYDNSSSAGIVAWGDNVNRTYGCAYDPATGKMWITKDGTNWLGGGNPASGTSPTVSGVTADFYLLGGGYTASSGSAVFTINDRTALTYAAPSGFTACGGAAG